MVLPILQGPFTVASYQRLGELGILRLDERVELIHGQVVAMTPIGDRHASCVRRLTTLVAPHVPTRLIVDVQNPVVLGATEAPQPDLTLLKPRLGGYPRHPRARDILLVIAVADTTLTYDRDVKIPLYAGAGVPEAWLVDVSGDRLIVCRQPKGDRYASVATFGRGDTVAPLRLPTLTLAVAEILG